MVVPAPELGLQFFRNIQERAHHHYVIILDKSGSMNACDSGTMSRWREAEQALRIIVPAVCHANPEGSTLYVFSSQYEVVPGLRTAADVDRVFRQHSPGGTTNLRPVLMMVVGNHQPGFCFRYSRGLATLTLGM